MSKFNFNIDIESDKQSILTKSTYNFNSQKELYELSLYTVDLGLPSGTLWCKYNLGVNPNKLEKCKDWYGNYYAWGEIKTKEKYNWQTYNFFNLDLGCIIKYDPKPYIGCDKLTQLLPEDDVAYLNIHIGKFNFYVSSADLYEELLENTFHEYVHNYKNIEDLNGWLFKSKNGNELFFPMPGYYESKVKENNYQGNYWTSNVNNNFPTEAWILYINDHNTCHIASTDRYHGNNVRPVLNLK